MTNNNKGCSRREFFKATGAAGVGALLSPMAAGAQTHQASGNALLAAGSTQVPTRPFGKTGIDVSILSLGGMFDIINNQLMLKQALRWGVTYWDTAASYGNGRSEEGFGKYFAKYPQDREKVFLVTKSQARNPKGISELLERSLRHMNTSYVDLYFIHGISNIDELGPETKRWAEKAKAAGKIKLFGFSTHSNMETLLSKAPSLGYIDGIMMTYNYRNMFNPGMQRAIEGCVKAGIGLTAMKTQAGRSVFDFTKAQKEGEKLTAAFMEKGFTEHQAKLKAVWTQPDIAAICSQMPNMTIFKANVAAAVDTTPLSSRDMRLFQDYAAATANQYCAGCSDICEAAVMGKVPIRDIMRFHMYNQSYGQLDWARDHFKALPNEVQKEMTRMDFRAAERRCPHHLPIAKMMRKALDDFA